MIRKTKIVATIGPSTQSESMIKKLIDAGMNVARLNFSHGTYDDHGQAIEKIRRCSKLLNKPVSILQDLQGPKLRIGILPKEGVLLLSDTLVCLCPTDESETVTNFSKSAVIPIDIPSIYEVLHSGDRIMLDDGKVELRVISISENSITAKVISGGILTSHKGINLPGVSHNIPVFTEKDKKDLAFGISNDIDMIAMSFIKNASDVKEIKNYINNFSPDKDILLVSKLERSEAISDLEEILKISDGVMIARGDLALETSPEIVPIIQKEIIKAANQSSVFVITATQMLESMMSNLRPTRAESSDIANAIFDGTDAVMLSGETAIGKYPFESLKMMDTIIKESEKHYPAWGICKDKSSVFTEDDALSIVRGAGELALDRNVSAIAVFTQSGRTALLMSKERPRVPIYAFTPEINTYKRLSIYWGVYPYFVPYANSVEKLVSLVDKVLLKSKNLDQSQQVVLISGFPVGKSCPPNFIFLHTIGQSLK